MHQNYRHFVIQRILARSIQQPSGCIEYPPTKHPYGLVSITVDGIQKRIPAHRAIWVATHEQWHLDRLTVIRHTCDNPRCVNICHLLSGSNKDNAMDCVERGRRAKKVKPHLRRSKLTEEQINHIRSKQEKPRWYCWKYRITSGYVSKLQNGKARCLDRTT